MNFMNIENRMKNKCDNRNALNSNYDLLCCTNIEKKKDEKKTNSNNNNNELQRETRRNLESSIQWCISINILAIYFYLVSVLSVIVVGWWWWWFSVM